MKNSIISLLLITMLLVFGCTGTAPAETPSEGDETIDSPTEGNETPAEAPEEGEAAPAGEDETTPAEPAPEGDPDEIFNFGDMDYSEIMALGVPVECDIITTYEGTPQSFKFYMNGENEVRTEFEVPPEEAEEMLCFTMISIIKDDQYYIGCQGSNYPPESSCDWLMFEAEAGEGEMESSGFATDLAQPEDFEDIPSTEIDCIPWIYDASKFDTPGNVCTMDDYMDELMAGMGDYS